MPEPKINTIVLRKALQHWDMGTVREITPLAGGHNGQVWLLSSSIEQRIVKFAWDAEPFAAGLRIAEQLETMGFSAGRPIRTRDGALVMHVEGGVIGVMEFVAGASPGLSGEGLRVWGTAMGECHRHLQRISEIPASIARWPWRWLDVNVPHVAERAWLRADVAGATAVAQRAIERGATLGIIHGDGAQVLADPISGRVGVIDWGSAMFGPLLYDVATAYWVIAVEHELGAPGFSSFIDSYREAGPLSGAELAMLPAFVQLRAVVQAFYFAWRCDNYVGSGLQDVSENEIKLDQAKQFLQALKNAAS